MSVICGGCLCGAVRYEAAGRPYNITHCHCADCRRSAGAPFLSWASFRRIEFRFTRGQPRELEWTGRWRSFCPACGTQLTFKATAEAEEVDVTVCSFDQPESISPQDHTWVEDRIPWVLLADNLPSYARARSSKSGA